MMALGTVWIGEYKIWITTPDQSSPTDPKACNLSYFEVFLTKEDKNGTSYYINPFEEFFKEIDFSDRNPLFKFKDKDNPKSTEEQFQAEYKSFLERKGSSLQPLWKMSRLHVKILLMKLISLTVPESDKS
jgi:hypothetical protein